MTPSLIALALILSIVLFYLVLCRVADRVFEEIEESCNASDDPFPPIHSMEDEA